MPTVMIQLSSYENKKDPSDRHDVLYEGSYDECVACVERMSKPYRGDPFVRWYIKHEDGSTSHYGDSEQAIQKRLDWLNSLLTQGPGFTVEDLK